MPLAFPFRRGPFLLSLVVLTVGRAVRKSRLGVDFTSHFRFRTVSDGFGPFLDRFWIVFGRFRTVSDGFGRFRIVFGRLRTVSDLFRTVLDCFRAHAGRFGRL